MSRRLTLLLLVLTLASSAHAQQGPVQCLQVGPLSRTYLLTRVGADQAKGKLPIVIFLHGLGTLINEGVLPRFDIPFETEPSLGPALVARPQGVDRRWDSKPGRIKTWTRLASTDGEAVDDIAFLRALIDHLVADENGDPARVYVAGVFAGGYLVPRVACEMGDKVAAVADVIATSVRSVFEACNPNSVPFALIASTTDDTNPYAGAPGNELTRLASAPETAFFFADHNGCKARAETPLPHRATEHYSTVSLTQFGDCTAGADVLFYRVDGSGHSVPSMAPIEAAGWAASGRRNRDMDTAQVLWRFLQSHRSTVDGPAK